MIWRHGILLTLCLALGALAAFYFSAGREFTPTSWSYTDLRLLDPADAVQPTHDLLAVYTRNLPDAVQIRLDMLEHAAIPDYDLYLALDTQPGGSRDLPLNAQTDLDWDVLLVVPASRPMQALDSQMQPIAEAGLRVVRDPVLDQLVISMSRAALRQRQRTNPLKARVANPEISLNLQALVAPPGSSQVSDRSEPSLAGEPLPPPARVLLAFWDTYPAYTPATALRRWNGAHTGPLGGSHGLLHLLRAARAEGAPLALLDLKYPAWLSALDFTAGTGLVWQLSQEGLLILPEYLPNLGTVDEAQSQTLEAAAIRLQQASEDFGLPPSPFRFTQPDYFPASPEFNLLLANLTQSDSQPGPLAPTAIGRWQHQRTLPIRRFTGQEAQAQIDGPSLDVRRALSQAALAAAQPGGEAVVLTLGGDLPASTWGAPAAASATLHYLKSRPWIQLLTAQDLQAAPATGSPGLEIEEIHPAEALAAQDNTALLEALRQAPANSLADAAWQAYFALYAPVYPQAAELPALRANYLGQVWSLLAAANWAEHPAPIYRCGVDPDQDRRPDCVLASEQLYAQIEIESGGLIYLFQRDPVGVAHQLIGPSSQVISGLSAPQSWDLTGGLNADPAVIPGAFNQAGLGYQASLTGDRLTLTTADRSNQKTYTLQANGLRLTYRTAQKAHLQIPLLLDPWARFTPGWSAHYQASPAVSGWLVTLKDDTASPLQVEIRSNTASIVHIFTDAIQFTNRAENPNMDYPPGFYLPFPLTEVGLGATPGQDTIVDILVEH
jgi:hypothetical protein